MCVLANEIIKWLFVLNIVYSLFLWNNNVHKYRLLHCKIPHKQSVKLTFKCSARSWVCFFLVPEMDVRRKREGLFIPLLPFFVADFYSSFFGYYSFLHLITNVFFLKFIFKHFIIPLTIEEWYVEENFLFFLIFQIFLII